LGHRPGPAYAADALNGSEPVDEIALSEPYLPARSVMVTAHTISKITASTGIPSLNQLFNTIALLLNLMKVIL
jgi:hypothetical protein